MIYRWCPGFKNVRHPDMLDRDLDNALRKGAEQERFSTTYLNYTVFE